MDKQRMCLRRVDIQNAALTMVAVLILMATSCKKSEPYSSGHITEDMVWSGTVQITGDVYVDAGVTLTILPGTEVVIAADEDDQQESQLGTVDDMTTGDPTADPNAGGVEFQKSHVMFTVNGTIHCVGTEAQPIWFKSSKSTPTYTDWSGINVFNGVFAYTVVEWCVDGIYGQENAERLIIDHCLVRHVWAACTGFHRPANDETVFQVTHSTIEDCGHEAIDTHDPGKLEIAYNIISASQVGLNLHDEMNVDAHHNLIYNTTFPVLCVNASNVFATHMTLQAQLQDNARWTYAGWTMPQLQDPACVLVDNGAANHLLITNSILYQSPVGFNSAAVAGAVSNGYLCMYDVATPYIGEVLEGAGFVYGDPLFTNPSAGDYSLQAGSPAKGAGNPADGSPDLGAYGALATGETLGWTP